VQVVGYETAAGDAGPALAVAESGQVRRVPLEPGVDVAYTLGDRHCAGVLDADAHQPCDRPTVPYCEEHTSTWVCARCTGTCLKDEMDCHQEHAVYLAAFAPATFKVGVTRSWRLDTRLREQGADRAAHVRTVENGRVAREIEAGIAEDIGDRVRVPEKIRGFHRDVDDDAWRALLDDYRVHETYEFDYGLDLDHRPVEDTAATGTVVGTKGRVLVLDRGGTAYAVDMRDLVGYELREGASSRDRQSNLGAFG
jgi:hypothetical protein